MSYDLATDSRYRALIAFADHLTSEAEHAVDPADRRELLEDALYARVRAARLIGGVGDPR